MKTRPTAEHRSKLQTANRKGAIAVTAAILMIPLLGMVAFAIDYGYLLTKRANLQRAADSAALAAVRDLVPADDGSQDASAVRAAVKQYAASNINDVTGFTVLDSDIEIGRYDPTTVYGNFTILNTGTFDTVRVTLRRDANANSPVPLFFARIFGMVDSDVRATGTAVLQKGSILEPGVGVLPFSIPKADWDATNPGDIWSIYGDGSMEDDSGGTIPGNWGTSDIGDANNSTSDISDQILNGLRQKDLDALHADGRIPTSTHIDSSIASYLNGDPGLSSGMKAAVQAIHGQTRLIPVYDTVTAHGANLEFHVVGWAVCRVIDSNWNGAKKTYVKVKKSFAYDGVLRPQADLGDTTKVIDGAFTSAVLVE